VERADAIAKLAALAPVSSYAPKEAEELLSSLSALDTYLAGVVAACPTPESAQDASSSPHAPNPDAMRSTPPSDPDVYENIPTKTLMELSSRTEGRHYVVPSPDGTE